MPLRSACACSIVIAVLPRFAAMFFCKKKGPKAEEGKKGPKAEEGKKAERLKKAKRPRA